MRRHTAVSSGTGSRPGSMATTPHRLRIVKCLFHCWIRQIEPVLQKIDPQHPLHLDRWAAIAWLGIKGSISAYRADHGTTRSISSRNAARRVVLAQRSNPTVASVNCFIAPNHCATIHPSRIISRSFARRFCRASLAVELTGVPHFQGAAAQQVRCKGSFIWRLFARRNHNCTSDWPGGPVRCRCRPPCR